MVDDVYELLASHLDALPNGFPRTESGIELKILKKIFNEEEAYLVNRERCIGCGVCVSTCPTEAMLLVRKPEEQWVTPPATMRDWMIQRAKNRGISLEGLL